MSSTKIRKRLEALREEYNQVTAKMRQLIAECPHEGLYMTPIQSGVDNVRAWDCRCLDCDGHAVICASDVEYREDPLTQAAEFRFAICNKIEERATYPAFFE